MTTERIDELLETFDKYNGVYQRQAVEEALILREEITPRLIRILEELAENPARYVAEDHYAHMYASVLLAHFQEPAAHQPIIRAFCIPDDPRVDVWGDVVMETLPALLLQTCGGRLDSIRELITERDAPEYVRGAGTTALTYAVARGLAERQETMNFFVGLFTGTEAEDESGFWGDIVCALIDLHPDGAMDAIRGAFAADLVFPGDVSMHDVEKALTRDREETLAQLRKQAERALPSDVHGYIADYACFDPEKSAPLPPSPPLFSSRQPASIAQAQQKHKAKNRARNKQAKKSRRKNRR